MKLDFKDAATLFQSFTPRRLEALDLIYQKGPLSVRGLAIAARRDYKNIYGDVRVLERVGLVRRTKDHKLTVPWCWVELRSGLRARGPASRRARQAHAAKSAYR
jgi:predicted transcriptional regulator